MKQSLLAVCLVSAPIHAWAAPHDVFPPLNNPRLRFHTGKVENGQPQISQATPYMAAEPPSPWFVAQWQQSSLISAESLQSAHMDTSRPNLGNARYAFTAPDGHSHVWIYGKGPEGSLVYELYQRGGVLRPGGASNLFLQAKAIDNPTFNQTIGFSVDARLVQSSIHYDTPTAQKSGAVLGMAFAGFALSVPDSGGKHVAVFIQPTLATSRRASAITARCFGPPGRRTVIIGGAPNGLPPLAFGDNGGSFTAVKYRLNNYVCDLVSKPIPCGKGDDISFVGTAPAQVKLNGAYIGLETNNIDERPRSRIRSSQGSVEMALQVSDLHITADPDKPFMCH